MIFAFAPLRLRASSPSRFFAFAPLRLRASSPSRFFACLGTLALTGAWVLDTPLRAQPQSQPQHFSIAWNKARQGAFVTSIVQDALGRILIGTEDSGVWRFAPSGRTWTRVLRSNGSATTRVYALACDKQGRIWIGTQNGVSVVATDDYNHDTIKSYRALDGLSGERVFALAVSPQNGDVWIGTNAGLTRYSARTDRWKTYTRENGLPAEDVYALAFAPDGTLFAGTQANGLAIASPQDDYRLWRSVPFERSLPSVPAAQNKTTLPSGQINAIRVLDNGTLAVATPTGLALSFDKGRTWNWKRGADWAAKVREHLDGDGTPGDWKQALSTTPTSGTLLAEDYVSALAQDKAGHLLVGTRQNGVQVLDAKGQMLPASSVKVPSSTDYVRAFWPLLDGSVLTGGYGSGLSQINAFAPTLAPKPKVTTSDSTSSSTPTVAAFPSPAAVPSLAELNTLLADLARVSALPDDAQPLVTALTDDWLTGGTQLGRYGRYWFCGCAMSPPTTKPNYIWGAGEQTIEYSMRMGTNANDDDSLRYFVTASQTDEGRSLELPSIYMHSRVLKGLATWDKPRRQSEADDHGEAYSMKRDGPHIYVNIKIPDGLFSLSLYDFNKDGWKDENRFRDYSISIRPHRDELNLTQIKNFDRQPELARGTIRDFVGGVWKRFLVRGPQELTIELNRNYSFNTILAGVTLDSLDEEPAPYFRTWEQNRVLDSRRAALRTALSKQTLAARAKRFAAGTTVEEVAERLFAELQRTRLTNATYWARENRRYAIPLARFYRDKVQSATSKNRDLILSRLGSCLHLLNQFDEWEKLQRMRGLTPARDIERALRWNGIPEDERMQGRRFVSEFLKLKAEMGLLALDPKNVEAEQTRRREELLAQKIEDLRFEPPTQNMVDKNAMLKPGVKLKERSPQEFAKLKARAEKYQPLDD